MAAYRDNTTKHTEAADIKFNPPDQQTVVQLLKKMSLTNSQQ